MPVHIFYDNGAGGRNKWHWVLTDEEDLLISYGWSRTESAAKRAGAAAEVAAAGRLAGASQAPKSDRRQCLICGIELAPTPAGKRGPKFRHCGPDCKRLGARFGEIAGLIFRIIENTPNVARARAIYRILQLLWNLRQEVRDPRKDL